VPLRRQERKEQDRQARSSVPAAAMAAAARRLAEFGLCFKIARATSVGLRAGVEMLVPRSTDAIVVCLVFVGFSVWRFF